MLDSRLERYGGIAMDGQHGLIVVERELSGLAVKPIPGGYRGDIGCES